MDLVSILIDQADLFAGANYGRYNDAYDLLAIRLQSLVQFMLNRSADRLHLLARDHKLLLQPGNPAGQIRRRSGRQH